MSAPMRPSFCSTANTARVYETWSIRPHTNVFWTVPSPFSNATSADRNARTLTPLGLTTNFSFSAVAISRAMRWS